MKLANAYKEFNKTFTKGTLYIIGDEVKYRHGILKLDTHIKKDFERFNEIVENNKITIVTGARRIGKTWLLQSLIEYNSLVKTDFKAIYACSDKKQAELYRKGLANRLGKLVMRNSEGRIVLHNQCLVRFVYNNIHLRGCSTDYKYVFFDDYADKRFYTDTSLLLEYMLPVIDYGRIVICIGDHLHYEMLASELSNKGINFREVMLHGNQIGRNLQRDWFAGEFGDLLKRNVREAIQRLR